MNIVIQTVIRGPSTVLIVSNIVHMLLLYAPEVLLVGAMLQQRLLDMLHRPLSINSIHKVIMSRHITLLPWTLLSILLDKLKILFRMEIRLLYKIPWNQIFWNKTDREKLSVASTFSITDYKSRNDDITLPLDINHWTPYQEIEDTKQKPNELIVFIICHIQIYMYKHIFIMPEAAQ